MSSDILSHKYPSDSFAKKLFLSKTFWIIFCGLMFAIPLYKSVNRKLPPPLPVVYELPSYELINQYGKPFGSNNLKGKVYIASFFFTSCPSVCTRLMKEMQTIQHRVRGLGTHIALTTFTVDPERDTPRVLLKRATKLDANPHIWSFLTADKEKLKNILNNGFKVAMGNPEEYGGNDSLYDIAHSERFFLVDMQGRVRGIYSSDTNGINKLMIDVGLLVNREVIGQEATKQGA